MDGNVKRTTDGRKKIDQGTNGGWWVEQRLCWWLCAKSSLSRRPLSRAPCNASCAIYRANKAQSLNKRIIFPSQCDLSKDPSKRASRPEIARVSASCPRNPKKNPHYTSAHVIREIPRKFARISVSFPSVCRVLRTWNDLSTEATLLNNTASLRPIQFFISNVRLALWLCLSDNSVSFLSVCELIYVSFASVCRVCALISVWPTCSFTSN